MIEDVIIDWLLDYSGFGPIVQIAELFGFSFKSSRGDNQSIIYQLEIDKIKTEWNFKSDILVKQTAFIKTYGEIELSRLDKNILLSHIYQRKIEMLREISNNSFFPDETRINAANAQVELSMLDLHLSKSSLESLTQALNITFDYENYSYPALNR